jgi:hypothetical protein
VSLDPIGIEFESLASDPSVLDPEMVSVARA